MSYMSNAKSKQELYLPRLSRCEYAKKPDYSEIRKSLPREEFSYQYMCNNGQQVSRYQVMECVGYSSSPGE